MRLFGGLFSGYSPDDPVTAYKKPATRKELFRQAFRENLGGLVSLNLLNLLFCVPLGLWCLLNILSMEDVLRGFQQEDLPLLVGTIFAMVLGMIPGILIASVGSAGTAYVTRNWARGQHAFLWQDFRDSVKKNWKQALLSGLISSALLLIVYTYSAFLLSNPDRAGISLFPALVTALFIVFWLVMRPVVMVQAVTYELKFSAILKNAAIMTAAHFLTGLGILAAGLLPVAAGVFIVLFIYPPAGSLLLIAYGFLFSGSFPWLLGSSFANRLCEEFLHPRIGAPVDIGLESERIVESENTEKTEDE